MAKVSNNFVLIAIAPILFIVVLSIFKSFQAADPLHFLYPNFLLFTPYRSTVIQLWKDYIKYDTSIIYEPSAIPEIEADKFSMESLKKATENWRYPAVVRGMFKDTPAVTKWITPEYLPSKIGEFLIPVVRTAVYGTIQNDRAVMTFQESFTEIVNNSTSKMYLFFPVKSRFNYNFSELGALEALQDKINEVVLEDLQVDKLVWQGFGTKKHSTYFGSQLIVGQGSRDTIETTGTGWHCAAGNNWFIQVAGRKRWYFLDPKYSAYMRPLRGGKVNMMTGNREMGSVQKHLPLRFVDLEAGDMLYNPDWEWHTIMNYEGLSIGVPIREVNVSLSLRNNLHYTMVVALNKVADRFGVSIGGYPPA